MGTTATAQRSRKAPGPQGHFLMGSIPDARQDPLQFYITARRLYGDVVRFQGLGRMAWYLFAHPEDVEYVLRRHYRNFRKGVFFRPLKNLLGEGLLTSEGDLWLRQRRLAQPAFHRKQLDSFASLMVEAAVRVADRWERVAEAAEPIDIDEEMMRVTLEVVGKALFSSDISGDARQLGEIITVVREHVSYRMMNPLALPDAIPTPRNRRYRRAVRQMDDLTREIIAGRRRSGEAREDLLSTYLRAREDDTGEGMDDEQILDEMKTLILAGHETTAVALTWCWYILSKYPAIERNLHDELDGVLGGRPPAFEDLSKLPYTRMVLQETLRLYPPAWSIGRQMNEADEIGGYHIPADSPLAVLPYVTHRHPDFWENPEGFEPERFAGEQVERRHQFAYFPFGAGPRQCIGMHFALMEAQLILATLAQRYRLELVAGYPVQPEPAVTLRPKYGMQVNLVKRRKHR